MKLVKLKNKKVIRKIVLSLLFIGFGFGLHMYLTPDYAAMMQANQEPFVSVKGLNYLDISEKKKFIATVEAINSVDLIPQVSGYVEEVLFQDGSYVKEGDVLFVIEQSKFQADVAAAEANLEKAKSDLIQMKAIINVNRNYIRINLPQRPIWKWPKNNSLRPNPTLNRPRQI